MGEFKGADDADTHATRFNPIAPLSRALSRLVRTRWSSPFC